ncbi:hypothetical protein BGX28_009630, partial [Mortierella sp. GBA30]
KNMEEVVTGFGIVTTLVAGIYNSAEGVRFNKRICLKLARKCRWVGRIVSNGALGSSVLAKPALDELQDLLINCDKDLKKFAGSGFLMRIIRSRGIPEICELHIKELDEWIDRIRDTSSLMNIDRDDAVEAEEVDEDSVSNNGHEDQESQETMEFIFDVNDSQKDAMNALLSIPPDNRLKKRAIVDSDYLHTENEQVGTFPFGKIYRGTYKGEAVYVREIGDDVPIAAVSTIRDGIMLAQCLSDCQAIVSVRGFCGERKIVTDMPANGPLSEYRGILTTLQKVVIARKVADSLVFMHDIAVGKRSVVHRDIRAANVLLSKDLEPMLTGFELCKGDGDLTGYYPEIKEIHKWWAPERLRKCGSSPASDVYSFGMLMFEISTGREPESEADLVALENNRLCAEYTALMKRCLQEHFNARPKIDSVVEELLTIESLLV